MYTLLPIPNQMSLGTRGPISKPAKKQKVLCWGCRPHCVSVLHKSHQDSCPKALSLLFKGSTVHVVILFRTGTTSLYHDKEPLRAEGHNSCPRSEPRYATNALPYGYAIAIAIHRTLAPLHPCHTLVCPHPTATHTEGLSSPTTAVSLASITPRRSPAAALPLPQSPVRASTPPRRACLPC